MKYTTDIPVLAPYEIVVCGGGPAGYAAALAARRARRKVLLVEACGQLGGVGTSAGVSIWLGYRSHDNRECVGGIFKETVDGLIECGGAVDPQSFGDEKYPPFGWFPGLARGISFEPALAAAFMEEKVLDAGVDLLYFTDFVDAIVEGRGITSVIIQNKSGLQAVPAQTVIDATGDADVAARSGCEVVSGREEDGLMTPASLIFTVDRVDRAALSNYIYEHESPRFRELIKDLRDKGEWPFPYEIFISLQVIDDDTFMINTTRLCGVDGTDGASLTNGMVCGRREVTELFAIMRKHIPGFDEARLRSVAPMLGVRETRRIISDYVMKTEDVIEGRDFEDTIGFSAYGWDLPDPKRPSYQPMSGKKVQRKRALTPIPYRIMVPRPVENLVCPGRAVSVERDVLGPLRVMAPCFAMGEAGGLAADQALERGVSFREVDTDALRDVLRSSGAIVD